MSANGQPTDKTTHIYSTINIEEQFYKYDSNNQFRGDDYSDAFWFYTSLPSIKIGKKKIFTAIEIDMLNKDFYLNDLKINYSYFQRYGLFTGLSLLSNKKYKSVFYIGGGIASDFYSLDSKCGYIQFIYDNHWILNSKLTLGIGILISYNSGSWKDPNPINFLPTLKWNPTSKLNIQINWDNFRVRRYLTKDITGILEVRYDMSFFRTSSNYTLYIENVGASTGLDVHLFSNFFLRLRYKEIFYSNDYILDVNENKRYKANFNGGRTILFSVIYGK